MCWLVWATAKACVGGSWITRLELRFAEDREKIVKTEPQASLSVLRKLVIARIKLSGGEIHQKKRTNMSTSETNDANDTSVALPANRFELEVR